MDEQLDDKLSSQAIKDSQLRITLAAKIITNMPREIPRPVIQRYVDNPGELRQALLTAFVPQPVAAEPHMLKRVGLGYRHEAREALVEGMEENLNSLCDLIYEALAAEVHAEKGTVEYRILTPTHVGLTESFSLEDFMKRAHNEGVSYTPLAHVPMVKAMALEYPQVAFGHGGPLFIGIPPVMSAIMYVTPKGDVRPIRLNETYDLRKKASPVQPASPFVFIKR